MEVLDGYIRVSQVAGREGDRFHSPGQQRESIEGWAQAHGIKIGMWHEDLDRSGGTMDRPGMNEAMRRVEAGATGGLVVARLDRFARTVIGGLTTIQKLHERGARVVSVAESIDPATPMGRAMLGLLLIMGEWQRDQAEEHLAAAQLRAAGAGRFPGRAPYGYRRDADGHTVIDETTGPIRQRIYEERARDDGWRLIADRLSRDGIPTPNGRERWSATTVIDMVRSEASLGVFIGPRGMRVENAWEALIDRQLWDQANERRSTRDSTRRHHDRLLAGIARCANCRHVLSRAVNPGGFVSYACSTVGCRRRGSVGAHILDGYVTELVDARLARLALEAQTVDDDGEGDRLRAAGAAATIELEAWRDDTGLRQALGDHDWREGLLARARARDDIEADMADYRSRRQLVALADLPGDTVPALEEMPWALRRQVTEGLLHSVWMRPSAHRGLLATRHVADRLKIVWRDDRDHPELPMKSRAQLPALHW